ncbi:MAG: ester cyclase [Rhodomicrobiaceae bacterium]
MADSIAVVEQWIAAYNARDADAQAVHYAEDASNWQHAPGEPVAGQEKIRENLAAFYRAFPDSVIETEAMLSDAATVAWFWLARGTWLGPFAGREPNGNAFSLHGSTLFVVEVGHIVTQRAYWDRASWFRLLGIPV